LALKMTALICALGF